MSAAASGAAAFALLDSEDVAWFFDGALAARGAAAALGRRIGLSEQRTAEVAVAIAEAGTNLTRHAVGGAVLLRVVRTEKLAGLEFLTVDSGPGMADVPASLRDGSSSAGTLGIGLGAVARLADAFDIYSLPGRGTVLAARFWPREGSGGRPTGGLEPVVAGLTRAISGEQVCGDAWAARPDGDGPSAAAAESPAPRPHSFPAPTPSVYGATSVFGAPGVPSGLNADGWMAATTARAALSEPAPAMSGAHPALLVMLCDGLGHGPMAALAAQAAVAAFRDGTARDPEGVMREIHRALRGTRGAALAVARIEPEEGRVLYCGVGNIVGTLVGPESRSGLYSHPGIVGHQMRGLRTVEQPLRPGAALVMHSDGLTERWSADSMPGLFGHSPIVVAGQLLREAGTRRDDASVVVAKGPWQAPGSWQAPGPWQTPGTW